MLYKMFSWGNVILFGKGWQIKHVTFACFIAKVKCVHSVLCMLLSIMDACTNMYEQIKILLETFLHFFVLLLLNVL